MTTESQQPTARSRENTRARLLDAAAQVFAEVGLGGASVETICERAGFTRGAFYSNFDSKDELFLELAGQFAGQQIAQVRGRVAELEKDPSFREEDDFASLTRVLDSLVQDRNGLMLHAEIRIRGMRDEAFGTALVEQEARLLDEIAAIIEDVVRVRRLPLRIDPRSAARLLVATWDAAATRAVLARTPDRERELDCVAEVARVAQLMIG
ncbi:TetR/AcrR family transcriptional regulator [Microbacterium sp. Marseille-Q6965]|uniref:TetR/AcrR family transcriptional regulator n=1 Tax=Microbacterium sp. Marseille-Q6965 TaxID=2965072 RepID=UPI0021B766D2|nr:TetR/AcrR family transcriptional regulator [Microbacterium sp. Marseille-Q6965]